MDIRELKDLLKNSTSVLILDEGEPSYVILDYQVYRNLTQAKEQEVKVKKANDAEALNFPVPQASEEAPVRAALSAQEVEALERLNREIQALKDQIEQDEKQAP
ncbi:MAG: hypothetical protein AAB479_01295 [Patescibacteria group bacterium]